MGEDIRLAGLYYLATTLCTKTFITYTTSVLTADVCKIDNFHRHLVP